MPEKLPANQRLRTPLKLRARKRLEDTFDHISTVMLEDPVAFRTPTPVPENRPSLQEWSEVLKTHAATFQREHWTPALNVAGGSESTVASVARNAIAAAAVNMLIRRLGPPIGSGSPANRQALGSPTP